MSGGAYEVDCEAVLGGFEHGEGFSEAEVAHYVEGEVVGLVGDVDGVAVAFGFGTVGDGGEGCELGVSAVVSGEVLAELADVGEDVVFHGFYCGVGEGVAQDSAFSGVDGFGDGTVGAEGVFGRPEGFVEASLADVGLESVNILQCGVRVKREAVWPESHDGSIYFVNAVEFEVSISA